MRSHLLLVVLFCTPASLGAQDKLNLGFEQAGSFIPGQPAGWTPGSGPLTTARDTTVAHSGNASLRINRDSASSRGSITARYLPVDIIKGHRLTISAWVKTAGVAGGFAALWIEIPGITRMVYSNHALGGRFVGDRDWTQINAEVDVDTAAQSIALGFKLTGSGTAWLDDVDLAIDGAPLRQSEESFTLNASQRSWATKSLIPIASARPRADLSDLRPMLSIIGEARIIGLGEATHGTAEFAQMKHRLLQLLASDHAKVIFAMEEGMPFMRRLNEFATTGNGENPLNPGPWRDMVSWIHDYNMRGPGRIELFGFDTPSFKEAIDSVRAFVARTDVSFVGAVDSAYAAASRVRAMTPGADSLVAGASRVLTYLEQRQPQLLVHHDSVEVAWAIRYASSIVQRCRWFLLSSASGARDSVMATNIAWIADRHPNTPLILSAHNAHISRRPSAMGAHLARMFGHEYRPVGFLFNTGEYSAYGPLGKRTYGAEPGVAGSFEQALHTLGVPLFALDLRSAQRDPSADWIAKRLKTREIGAFALDDAFTIGSLWPTFDAIIYFEHTEPAVN